MLNIATIDLGGERAGATDLRRAAAVAVVLVGCCLLAVPIIKYQLGVSYPIFAIVIALSIAAIAVTSVLLWAQASVTRSVPLSVIAAGYALTAIVMLPYMLFFRNLWPQLAILFSSDAQTSPWLYVAWHVIFIYSPLAYVLVRRHYGHAQPLDATQFANVRNRISRVAVIVIARYDSAADLDQRAADARVTAGSTRCSTTSSLPLSSHRQSRRSA